MVLKHVNYFINDDEAKEWRSQLMAERTLMQDAADEALSSGDFNFCEH